VGDAYFRQSEATLPKLRYRDIFRDPKLRTLTERAVANNQDLKAGLANVAFAGGQLRLQRAELLPGPTAPAATVSGTQEHDILWR
jgi:outer membrane protein, multidrug efflux system